MFHYFWCDQALTRGTCQPDLGLVYCKLHKSKSMFLHIQKNNLKESFGDFLKTDTKTNTVLSFGCQPTVWIRNGPSLFPHKCWNTSAIHVTPLGEIFRHFEKPRALKISSTLIRVSIIPLYMYFGAQMNTLIQAAN